MPRAKTKETLWNTSWSWQQVATAMEKKAPARAKLYRALHSHEYMTTEAIVKAMGKDPKRNSDVTTILGGLRELRNQGLIVSELVEKGGKGGKTKHKKCAKPLAVPQESPKKQHGKRAAARRNAAKAGATTTNGGQQDKQVATPTQNPAMDHPDPLSNILTSLDALNSAVGQIRSLVEAEIEREAQEAQQMEKFAQQLSTRAAARRQARSGGGTRH